MFLKNYLILIVSVVLFIIPPPVFSSPSCEYGAFSGIERSGMESYRELLVRLAKSSLGVERLSPQQIEALETYHRVVQGQAGIDGTFARVGNYTVSQVKQITMFLRKVFSSEQVASLMEEGVVEMDRVDPFNNMRGLSRHFFLKRKEAVAIVDEISLESDSFHRGKVTLLERSTYGALVGVEKVDLETGEIFKEKWFFPIVANKGRFNSFSEVSQILEKTDNGFVISNKEGDRGYFLFEKAIENGLLPENPTARDYRTLEDTLMYYLSGQWDRVPFLKGASYSVLSKKHKIYIDFMKSLDNSMLKDSYYFNDVVFILNSEMEMTFLAAKSKRKTIRVSDLNLPSVSGIESQLRAQGYSPGYTRGIDLIKEWIVVRERLQQLKANSYITHIEYFANQVPHHIAHIREGLEKNYSPKDETYGTKSKQLQKLNNLEKRARKVILDEKVTYKWWLEFNRELSEIMSGIHDVKLFETSQIVMAITLSYFPFKVVFPTIEANIGIMTFNRAGIEGVYPGGLINHRNMKADRETLTAFDFLLHDFDHALMDETRMYREHPAGHHLFHKRLLHNIESLPLEKRKKAEAVYFLMTHENEEKNISYSDMTLPDVREAIEKTIRENEAEVFKFSDDLLRKEKKVRDLTDTFMEIYNQTLQHQ